MIRLFKEAPNPISLIFTTEEKPSEPTNTQGPSSTFNGVNAAAAVAAAQYNELGRNLLQAAAKGDIHEVTELLSSGCPFTADWLGVTPLHLAAQHNQYEVCDALIKGGITKDARNKVDRSPLHLAVHEGHYEIVELLLENGADINCVDMLNMTPLHWAVQNEHIQIVDLLLRYNAKLDIRNKFDLIPRDIAYQVDNLDIIELLQAYVEDPQAATDSLVAELQNIEQNNEFAATIENENDSVLEPVVIVDETGFVNLQTDVDNLQNSQTDVDDNLQNSQTDVDNLQNSQTDVDNNEISETGNNESYLISICDNEEENYTQAGTKDPVIINLAKDINEEMPDQFSEKSSGTPLSNLKLLQPGDHENDNNFSAMQLLQEHGITIIPNDGEDTSILNAVMENGHSVVLTDIGKEVLNTVKQQEENQGSIVNNISEPEPKNVITISPEQFLSMTANKQEIPVPVKIAPFNKTPVKRIVMKKNRLTPYGNDLKIRTNSSDKPSLDVALKELADAKKMIAEYKTKLELKEMELEKYKKRIHVVLVDPTK